MGCYLECALVAAYLCRAEDSDAGSPHATPCLRRPKHLFRLPLRHQLLGCGSYQVQLIFLCTLNQLLRTKYADGVEDYKECMRVDNMGMVLGEGLGAE